MMRSWLSLSAVLILLTAVLPFSNVSRAQEPDEGRRQVTGDPEGVSIKPRAQRSSGPVTVFVELTGQPSTVAYAARKNRGGTEAQAVADAQGALAQNVQAQQRLLPRLQSLGTPVVYRVQRVLNGIAVRADANQQASLARLPGVRKVTPIVTKYLDNASSVPLIGTPDVWRNIAQNTQYTGEGMTIGVIDTGIDYLHTDFDGSGSGYETNDFTVVEAGGGFPNAKVVGGYDFAGDEYDARFEETSVPQPDPDPMDCNGHGSHVAGTATGLGVNGNGTTYTGPYNQNTPFDTLRIGPGVAPGADLYGLRVFGCDGSTDLTDQAIEYAVDPNGDGDFGDHLDVINMSLGSSYGGNEDTTAIASNNAALANVIVVASAGNSNDTTFITGSPGSASRAISTASSVDSTTITDGFRVNSPAPIARVHPALFSVNYDWTNSPDVTGRLVYPESQPSGCQPYNAENRALIAGKIVLIQWTELAPGTPECGSGARAGNVVAAGGIGAIMYDNSEIFDLSISGSAVIPAVSTPREVGEALLDYIDQNISVTFSEDFRNSAKLVTPEQTDTMSVFSSRGPQRQNLVKPDVSAPGQTIFSAAALTGNEGTSINGTSMASPHVAGAMALMRQIHPDWTVEQLKALIMNTAGQNVRSDLDANSQIYGPSRQGAGRVELPEAAASNVVAYNADGSGTVSVSFGEVEVVDTATMTKTVKIENLGTITETFDLFYLPVTTVPGVEFSILGPNIVSVGAESSILVTVQMTADASEMRHVRDATLTPTQVGEPRHYLSEHQGYMRITPRGEPGGRPNLRVPLHANPRPASDMRASQGAYPFDTSEEDILRLTGQGVATGTSFPEDTISLVSVLELQHSSDDDAALVGDANAADLKYVGAASSFGATGVVSETMIYIGIATYGEWSTANYADAEFDVYINTDDDPEDEYVAYNSARANGTSLSDVFIVTVVDLTTNQVVYDDDYINGVSAVVDSNPFNNSVMTLPLRASVLGLTDGDSRFEYDVVSFTRNGDGVVDVAENLTYDPAAPGIDTSAAELAPSVLGVTYPDLPGVEIPVEYDAEAYAANESEGILLLHHHNVRDRTSEAVLPELVELRLPLVFP